MLLLLADKVYKSYYMSSGFKIMKGKNNKENFLSLLDLKIKMREKNRGKKNKGIIYACFSQAQDINRYKLDRVRVRGKEAVFVPTLQ